MMGWIYYVYERLFSSESVKCSACSGLCRDNGKHVISTKDVRRVFCSNDCLYKSFHILL